MEFTLIGDLLSLICMLSRIIRALFEFLQASILPTVISNIFLAAMKA